MDSNLTQVKDSKPEYDYYGTIYSFKPLYKVLDTIYANIESYISSLEELGEDEQAVEWIDIINGIKENGIHITKIM